MRAIKQSAYYFTWVLLSLVFGMLYMRIVLGKFPNDEDYHGFGFFLNLFYHFGLIYVGLIIGCIIALFFILTDVFIIKRKLGVSIQSMFIRLGILVSIAFLVGLIHFLLEKVFDII